MFEDDPNLTNKRFPGSRTSSYRSLTEWHGHTPEQLKEMHDRLERLNALGVQAIVE